MKRLLSSLLLVSGLLASARASDAPPITIERAIQLAQEALRDKGAESDTYIEGITLERSSVMGSRAVWIVNWSRLLPASKPGSKERGLQINMQGDVVHLVEGGTTGGSSGHTRKMTSAPTKTGRGYSN